jgi:hypothetical protein
MNAPELIDYLHSDLCLADVRALDRDQLVRLEQALHHWAHISMRELRERTRLAKEEEAE